jgi:hypothetical protein
MTNLIDIAIEYHLSPLYREQILEKHKQFSKEEIETFLKDIQSSNEKRMELIDKIILQLKDIEFKRDNELKGVYHYYNKLAIPKKQITSYRKLRENKKKFGWTEDSFMKQVIYLFEEEKKRAENNKRRR